MNFFVVVMADFIEDRIQAFRFSLALEQGVVFENTDDHAPVSI